MLHLSVIVIKFIAANPPAVLPVSFFTYLSILMVHLRITIRTAIHKSKFAFKDAVTVIIQPDACLAVVLVLSILNFLIGLVTTSNFGFPCYDPAPLFFTIGVCFIDGVTAKHFKG